MHLLNHINTNPQERAPPFKMLTGVLHPLFGSFQVRFGSFLPLLTVLSWRFPVPQPQHTAQTSLQLKPDSPSGRHGAFSSQKVCELGETGLI